MTSIVAQSALDRVAFAAEDTVITSCHQVAGRSLERIAALSDGVFAI
jgi:hypothetical protein